MIEEYLNKIHCGDCLDFMKQLPDKCVDMCITSPPYNVGANNVPNRKNKKYAHSDDNLSGENYFYFLELRLREMIRVSKYVFFNIQSLSANKIALIELKYIFRNYYKDEIIWAKSNPAPAINKGCLNSGHENIWIFSENDCNGRSFKGQAWQGKYNNVITTPSFTNNPYKLIHNACFPLTMPTYCLSLLPDATIVFDPFMGSGTTSVACYRTRRNFIGCEISPEYCAIAEKRLQDEKDKLALFSELQ